MLGSIRIQKYILNNNFLPNKEGALVFIVEEKGQNTVSLVIDTPLPNVPHPQFGNITKACRGQAACDLENKADTIFWLLN